jgi:hypothetical protein
MGLSFTPMLSGFTNAQVLSSLAYDNPLCSYDLQLLGRLIFDMCSMTNIHSLSTTTTTVGHSSSSGGGGDYDDLDIRTTTRDDYGIRLPRQLFINDMIHHTIASTSLPFPVRWLIIGLLREPASASSLSSSIAKRSTSNDLYGSTSTTITKAPSSTSTSPTLSPSSKSGVGSSVGYLSITSDDENERELVEWYQKSQTRWLDGKSSTWTLSAVMNWLSHMMRPYYCLSCHHCHG